VGVGSAKVSGDILRKALEALGFSTPFLYAAVTYGLFHLLDRKASGPAKNAIHEWLNSKSLNDYNFGAALLETFDRVYQYPFLRLASFLRVVLYSLILMIAVLWEFRETVISVINDPLIGELSTPHRIIVIQLITNIVCDYISLPFVRYGLYRLIDRPLFALFLGPAIGALVIFLITFSVSTGLAVFDPGDFWRVLAFRAGNYFFLWSHNLSVLASGRVPLEAALLLPAIAIHLWLPLLAIGLAGTRLLYWFTSATQLAQWFIKQGRWHALDAVGFVAAFIVLVTTAVLQ
jgi:hypothetical protein